MAFWRNKKWLIEAIAGVIGLAILIFIFATQHNHGVNAGDTIEFGGYSWQVLDVHRNHALIITENTYMIGEGRHNHIRGGITWAGSLTRRYLNDEFFYSFSAQDRARIQQTYVITPDSPWYYSKGGDNTTDRIFILSVEEVVRYFGDSGQLQNRPDGVGWISDQYNCARITRNEDGMPAWWWLRSSGGDQHLTPFVDPHGVLTLYGTGASNTTGGVRPVLWLNLAPYSRLTSKLSNHCGPFCMQLRCRP